MLALMKTSPSKTTCTHSKQVSNPWRKLIWRRRLACGDTFSNVSALLRNEVDYSQDSRKGQLPVGLHANPIRWQPQPLPKSGIERYFTMLAKNLPTSTSLATSNRSHTGVLRIGPNCRPTSLPAFRPRRLSGFLNALAWSAHQFDLVHLMNTARRNSRPSIAQRDSLVLTVHDLIHEIRGAPPDLLDRTARQQTMIEQM